MPAPAPLPIEEGSIVQAKVSRLEAYGAFCELLLSQTQTLRFNLRGLIHISQLANFKVDKVDDVVSLEDIVWVKVIQLETLEGDNGRPRYKIGLSMKQVSQENGRDTDASRQQQEASLASQQIQRHLSSAIGMGVALDPMASQHLALNNNRNLILKHQAKQETVINGYALVPAEEDEQEILVQAKVEEPKVSAAATRNTGATTVGQARGRGRGMTLPAWMTHQSAPAEGPVQTSRSLEFKDNEKDKQDPSENKTKNESNTRKRHKESKHDKKKRRRHDHSESSSDDESEERDRKQKRKHKHTHKHRRRKHDHHRKRDRKRREHNSEEEDSRSTTSSRSDDSSREHRTKRRNDDEKRTRRTSRRRSRSQSPASADNNGKDSRKEFQSIQEAQRIIEQIQAKKDKQRRDKQRAN